ncbi:MAG: MBOAT family protein, partial [Bdellovibrionales bacterium]|nr:MBOAT family protein [Bdellovibrionales bacterium]
MLSIAFDYFLSHRMSRAASASRRRLFLHIGVGSNLLLLIYYKYANFFVAEGNKFLMSLGLPGLPWGEVLLPIGISFFTFQKLSYLVDVYRQTAAPARSLANYALFVSFFPQLIAGPIVRYYDISAQIEARSHNLDSFTYGVYRFSVGLAKKVLIADCVGLVADHVFEMDPGQRTIGYAWLGILSYSVQIYFDFSGYSDMAIGLASMCGFRLLENFNCPYTAKSFTDFWRRWHISLSNWMREYLYIPLGGNRRGQFR